MAYCSLYQTSNMGFQPMPSDPEVCMTYSCPNPTPTPMDDYFQQSSWGSNINNSCMKPLADAIVSKQYRCDERWYDWFTVPNYHLGNGFFNPDSSNPGVCYNPCAVGKLPAYNTDPIDGQTLHFVGNSDSTNKCISRSDYFGGKYAPDSDYCPLAWIYILNSTPQTLDPLVKSHNDTFTKSDIAKNVLTDAFKTNQNNSKLYANTINAILPIELNNIDKPSSYTQNACNKMETKERLLPAYAMCSNLMLNEADVYNTFAKNMPATLAKNKVIMVKQACNAVFCNLRDPAPSIVGKKPLCFKNVGRFNPSSGEIIKTDKLPPPKAPEPIPQKTYMMHSIKTAIYLVIVPVLAYFIYIFVTDVLYPYIILPIYLKLLVILGFKPRSYDEEVINFRDSNMKLERLQKQCKNSKLKFEKDNELLREQGLPELPMPSEFPKCVEEQKAIAEHKKQEDMLNARIAEIKVPDAPAPSSGGIPGAGAAKSAASGIAGLANMAKGLMGKGGGRVKHSKISQNTQNYKKYTKINKTHKF